MKKIKLHKIQLGVCPYCGNTDKLFAESMELHKISNELCRKIRCGSCDREFEEWYTIKFSGVNVGEFCETAISDGEENIEIEEFENE